MSDWIQRHEGIGGRVLIIAVSGIFAWGTIARLLQPAGTNVGDPAIFRSAAFAALAWLLGVVVAVDSHYVHGRPEPRAGFRDRRLLWTAGCFLMLLHIAVAMHAGHAWSHESAFLHTEEVSGFGFGLYVNYAFAGAWTLDVLAMWVAPDAYRKRPRWLGLAVHGFLAFIVFNATVVFAASPFTRAVALLFTAKLVSVIVTHQRTAAAP